MRDIPALLELLRTCDDKLVSKVLQAAARLGAKVVPALREETATARGEARARLYDLGARIVATTGDAPAAIR